MAENTCLLVFLGSPGQGRVEKIVYFARRAATLDTVEAALASGAFTKAIVVTDDAEFPCRPPSLVVDLDSGPFHFGQRLARVLLDHKVQTAVYLGGGSLPLLSPGDFLDLSLQVRTGGVVSANNSFSSDMVAFSVSEGALAAIPRAGSDNSLARSLAAAGLTITALPRTLATQMDIDGPSDLATLKLTRLGGPHLQALLQNLDVDVSRYRRAIPLFTSRQSQVLVAGRVGSHVWQYLERETACHVRLFAEERGMRAEGRDTAGTARSLVGAFLRAVGIESFFSALAELADAAFIDTRVILAHLGLQPTREDRFLSDLGNWREIANPFLKDLTRAAVEASAPVLLGGHSLVSGDLMALNEFAWQQHDAGNGAAL